MPTTTIEDTKAKQVCSNFEQLKSSRGSYERAWQDIRELVRPNAADFQRRPPIGEVRTESIYDGTAPQALEELGSALHSYMTSPTERWFSLEIDNEPDLNREPEVIEYMELIADAIYSEYADSKSNHSSALNEAYLDIGAFGNCVLGQEYDPVEQTLLFRTHALSDCYLKENHMERIDTCYRQVSMDSRQLIQQFGEEVIPQDIKESNDANKKYDVIHAVYPRNDRDPERLTATNMPFASCWVLKDKGITLSESGYTSFPYHAARWSKLSGELYGRGPAIKCLPDIKMLNRIEFTLIKATQKAVDPPLVIPNEGFLLPIKTAPGSLIFREPGEGLEITPLEHRGNIPMGFEHAEQKREFIRKCFFADWVKLMPKKERQTAFEVAELVEQQLRMMAPMLGRLQSELHGPMLRRSYLLLHRAGRLPDPPAMIEGAPIRISYISPAAKAQTGTKAVELGKLVQELLPIAQIKPDIMDAIDFDLMAQELAIIRGTTRRVIRSSDQVAAIRQQRQDQEQAQQLLEAAEPASQAALNLAKANEAGGIF